MKSLWLFLILLDFTISLQTSHSFVRKRNSGESSASVVEEMLSQRRLFDSCYPENPNSLRKETEDSVEGTSTTDACPWCVPEKCQLPNCKCSTFNIPGKIPRNNTPIIIIVTMQNALLNSTYKAFLELFDGLRNPNGCPATGTYFVSHLHTDYFLAQSLRSKGHEIGDNTVSATNQSQEYWKNANCCTWLQEFGDAKVILKSLANVTDVRGFRAPYLQPGGDFQLYALEKMLQDQQQGDEKVEEKTEERREGGSFVYDSSRVSVQFSMSSQAGILWPYTFDYKSIQDCVTPSCPINCHKGIWEIPLLAFRDRFKKACATLDACDVQTYRDVFRLLYDRFSDRFVSNRAPLILSMDSKWITEKFKFKGTRLFLEHALSYKEVYVVSAGRALEWIRKPVSLSNIAHFVPWGCSQPDPPVCAESLAKICTYDSNRRQKTGEGVVYQFRTCAPQCPKCYPWLGDARGTLC